jgi:hypothetical protein
MFKIVMHLLTSCSQVDGSVVQDFKTRGASVHGVSYEDESELENALKGVDVVLSTLNAGGITGAQVGSSNFIEYRLFTVLASPICSVHPRARE